MISTLPAKLIRNPPVRIDTVLTKDEFLTLVRHMLNGNPLSHFLVIHRDDKGDSRFSKAHPNKRVDTHAAWAWDTITDKAKIKTSLGLYPKNEQNESTWGALDFDAHSGGAEMETQKERAIRAFTLLLEYRDRHLILSASGRGYHVFVLAREPRPVTEWTALLKDTVSLLPEGQCELFPAEGTEDQPVGKGIRFPGAYNPKTDAAEFIIAETIRPLLDRLKVENSSTLTSNSFSPSKLVRDKEAKSYYYKASSTFLSPSSNRLIGEILDKYSVEQKSTRNGVLLKLSGRLFNRFGFELARSIVKEHYGRYEAKINTPVEEHMGEFDRLWKFIIKKNLGKFSEPEKEIYAELHTQPQQEAFFIIRSFAKTRRWEDFSIAQASLADRLSISQQGAGCVIERMISLQAIKKTAQARINSKPATYRWTANDR
jgi:hypothetical protein